MKAKKGQVAVYLVLVLVALAVLMLTNVNVFLAVRSKNRMMNAVDAAALAAAKYQGYLLNRIGEENVARLRAAVLGEPYAGPDLRTLSFFGPIEALVKANDAAREWGYETGKVPDSINAFLDHLGEIRNDAELYPRSEENQLWPMYADRLAAALSGPPAVLPSYMEMVNPGTSGLFGSGGFYDVLAAKAWCWFTIGGNSSLLEGDPTSLPPAEVTPAPEYPENSEVFSLHVTYQSWADSDWAEEYEPGVGFSEKWTNFVCQVTGLEPADFVRNSSAADPESVWAFYDGNWKKWSSTFNPDNFPIAGSVRPEYDVAGCVAACMMIGEVQQIEEEGEARKSRDMLITADAKPLGTVEDLEGGGRVPVTAYNRFIAASRPGEQIFTEAQLALVGSVPRSPGVSMESGWYEHVKHHSPKSPSPGCDYCTLWSQWCEPSYRRSIQDWIKNHAEECRPKGGCGPAQKGGYPYAH